MTISTFLTLIIFFIMALSLTLCFITCIRCNIQQRMNQLIINNRNRNNRSISDNYLYDETKNNNIRVIENDRAVPPINHMPIVTGEKVDNIHNGITVITVEN